MEAGEKIIENYDSGIFWFVALTAPAIYKFSKLLPDPVYIFYTHGENGKGKTLSNKIALSLFGNPEELFSTLNSTNINVEGEVLERKDTVVLLDEEGTHSPDDKKSAEHLVNLIYRLSSGRERGRAKITGNPRQRRKYRGIILFTSERSFKTLLFSGTTSRPKLGTLRRIITVPANNLYLFDEELGNLYNTLRNNHGNLIGDWISFLKREENLRKLRERFELHRDALVDRYPFRGQQYPLALLFAVIEVAGELFGFNVSRYVMSGGVNDKLIADNWELYRESVIDQREKFLKALLSMQEEEPDRFLFPSDDPDKEKVKKIYGKFGENFCYLTTSGLIYVFKKAQIDVANETEAKRKLVLWGLAEPDEKRVAKRTHFSYRGKTQEAVKVYFSSEDGEEQQPQNTEEDYDSIDF